MRLVSPFSIIHRTPVARAGLRAEISGWGVTQVSPGGVPLPAADAMSNLATFLLLVAAFLLAGLIGHDPWKQDETYVFGMIHHLMQGGDWVVPMVAGEPFMEKPPLYNWAGAATAWLFSPWLAPHDGARLATGVFMFMTSGALGWTARHWWGPGFGRIAVLAFLACLGLVVPAHLILADSPLLTGFALAMAGFAMALARPLAGGVTLGVGTTTGFLAKGLLAPGVIGVTALLLPLLFRNWRPRAYRRMIGIALVVALPALLAWPVALYCRSPALFEEWFWANNVGRFLGFSVLRLGAPHTSWFWSQTLPWFTFPALPLALYSLWQRRTTAMTEAPCQFAIVLFVVLASVLGLSASARENYALPLLLPAALLAAPATIALPAVLDRYWHVGSRVVFGTLAAAIWTVWAAMTVSGSPPDWPILTRDLSLDFVPPPNRAAIAIGCLFTMVAIALWTRTATMRARGLVSWVSGVMLCWSLLGTLWLDWIDNAKSYRSVFASMRSALPYSPHCIASAGLGESERAMLHYFLGVETQRREVAPNGDCDVLLVGGLAADPPDMIDHAHWLRVWDGARPGDRRERLWLFVAPKVFASAQVAPSPRLPSPTRCPDCPDVE